MKKAGTIYFLSLFLFCISHIMIANDQREIKKFLLSAIDFSCYSTFKCSNLQLLLEDKLVSLTFYNYAKNEKEYFARYERNWGQAGGTAIYVRNPKGDFFWREQSFDKQVIANTVIQTKLPMNAFAGLIALKLNLFFLPANKIQPHFSVVNSYYNNIPSYRITVKYPDSDNSVALINRIPLATFDALPETRKDAFRKNTYTTFDLTISRRKKSPFIYRYHCYNVLGATIFSVDLGQPDFMALDKTIFEIPDVTIRVAENKEDFKKVAKRRYAPPSAIIVATSKCLQNIWQQLERLGIFFLERGSIIMLTIAIGSIVIVVVLKIKERKT